jgi:nucleoid DNA-binding protein
LPDKQPYKGPCNIRTIAQQIILDGKEQGIELSYNFIYRVVWLFFRRIYQHIKKHDYIIIEGFGEFGMTKAKEKSLLNPPKEVIKKKVIDAEQRHKKRLDSWSRYNKKKTIERQFKRVNDRRAKLGWKLLTMEEFKTLARGHKHYKRKRKFKQRKVKPINNYTFDVLEELDT